jgi:hypothetical protein
MIFTDFSCRRKNSQQPSNASSVTMRNLSLSPLRRNPASATYNAKSAVRPFKQTSTTSLPLLTSMRTGLMPAMQSRRRLQQARLQQDELRTEWALCRERRPRQMTMTASLSKTIWMQRESMRTRILPWAFGGEGRTRVLNRSLSWERTRLSFNGVLDTTENGTMGLWRSEESALIV